MRGIRNSSGTVGLDRIHDDHHDSVDKMYVFDSRVAVHQLAG